MAIKFEKIEPGMTLWDVRRTSGLQKFNGKWSCWPVYVKEVDSEKRQVLASWNGNSARWMTERQVTKFRAKKPEDQK